MDSAEVLKHVNAIFVDVLDDTHVTLSAAMTSRDVPGWDSLTHIQLVVAVEKHFKIRFTSTEIQSWSTVGDMIATIRGKLP